MQKTNGFVFVGLVSASSLIAPTIIQLKKNYGYNFALHASGFLVQGVNTNLIAFKRIY